MTAEEVYQEHGCNKRSEIIEAMITYAKIKCEEQREICSKIAQEYGVWSIDYLIRDADEPKFD